MFAKRTFGVAIGALLLASTFSHAADQTPWFQSQRSMTEGSAPNRMPETASRQSIGGFQGTALQKPAPEPGRAAAQQSFCERVSRITDGSPR